METGLVLLFLWLLELNNRIILQWGVASYSNLASNAIFPISFSNTNYAIVCSGVLEDSSQAFTRGVLRDHKNISNCLFRASEVGGPASIWLAIGY